MSIASTVIKGIFTLRGASKPISPKKQYRVLRKNALTYRRGEGLRLLFRGVGTTSAVYYGMRYYLFTPKDVESDTVILYLYGSAYTNPHCAAQERFVCALARRVHVRVFFPIYPKLPCAAAEESFRVLTCFFDYLRKQSRVILVGDSSGASLCLAIASERKEAENIVVISPWVILDLDERAEKMQSSDAVLSVDRLRFIARLWRGDLTPNAPVVSPFFGRYEGKNIYLLYGNEELFYPDISDFFDRCRQNKVAIERFVGEGQGHAFPLMPTPEGREARERIFDVLQRAVYTREA